MPRRGTSTNRPSFLAKNDGNAVGEVWRLAVRAESATAGKGCRAAVRWVLSAYCVLLLAYVGSRFVLEVILQKA